MSIITDELPRQYEYDGRIYDFHTDFREWIRFELLMLDEDIIPDERVKLIPHLIFPEVPPDPKLGEFILWFYSCGRRFGNGKSGKGRKKAAVYSFEYDDGYIYAAFMENYGIDLTSIEYLHWWKFKALFKSLHDCKLCEIMAYRSEEITDKTPLWRRKQIEECQRIYALPKSLSEQQKIAEAKRIMRSMQNENTALG